MNRLNMEPVVKNVFSLMSLLLIATSFEVLFFKWSLIYKFVDATFKNE